MVAIWFWANQREVRLNERLLGEHDTATQGSIASLTPKRQAWKSQIAWKLVVVLRVFHGK
jgi:hypothetical protein